MAILSRVRPSLLALCFGTLAACGGGASSPSATATTPRPVATSDAADPSCPMAVTGTSVSVEDTATGAALVFVTTSDVAELRKRVGALAQMHNDRHSAMGPLPDGTEQAENAGHDHAAHAGHDASGAGHAGHDHAAHAGHAGHGGHVMGAEHAAHAGHAGHDHAGHAGHAGGMIGVHSKAEAADIEGGAKITFTAFPADIAKMQSELRMHAQHMAGGTCQMKHH